MLNLPQAAMRAFSRASTAVFTQEMSTVSFAFIDALPSIAYTGLRRLPVSARPITKEETNFFIVRERKK